MSLRCHGRSFKAILLFCTVLCVIAICYYALRDSKTRTKGRGKDRALSATPFRSDFGVSDHLSVKPLPALGNGEDNIDKDRADDGQQTASYGLKGVDNHSTGPGTLQSPLIVSSDQSVRSVDDTSTVASVPASQNFSAAARIQRVDFDPTGNDSMVFIHIQKTSGTVFQQHLITLQWHGKPLCSAKPRNTGEKKVHAVCPRSWEDSDGEPWLVTEKVVGWFCGPHATFTEFKTCLHNQHARSGTLSLSINPHRNFLFITILRHPVLRYLSEYFHMQRGAKWSTRHRCGGREVRDIEMPPCYPGFYKGEEWKEVKFESFVSCDSNWASNRQVMQIADLETAGCYNQRGTLRKAWEMKVLESAKQNLASFAFFGLTEYEKESGMLFEETFGVEFGDKMEQRLFSELHSAPVLQNLWEAGDMYQKIVTVNHLDMALYEFALGLFESRLAEIGVNIDRKKVDSIIATLSPDSLKQKEVFLRQNFNLTLRSS